MGCNNLTKEMYVPIRKIHCIWKMNTLSMCLFEHGYTGIYYFLNVLVVSTELIR